MAFFFFITGKNVSVFINLLFDLRERERKKGKDEENVGSVSKLDTLIFIGRRYTRPMQIAAAIIPARLKAPVNFVNQHASVG